MTTSPIIVFFTKHGAGIRYDGMDCGAWFYSRSDGSERGLRFIGGWRIKNQMLANGPLPLGVT
jgi:hypothetical protein